MGLKKLTEAWYFFVRGNKKALVLKNTKAICVYDRWFSLNLLLRVLARNF